LVVLDNDVNLLLTLDNSKLGINFDQVSKLFVIYGGIVAQNRVLKLLQNICRKQTKRPNKKNIFLIWLQSSKTAGQL